MRPEPEATQRGAAIRRHRRPTASARTPQLRARPRRRGNPGPETECQIGRAQERSPRRGSAWGGRAGGAELTSAAARRRGHAERISREAAPIGAKAGGRHSRPAFSLSSPPPLPCLLSACLFVGEARRGKPCEEREERECVCVRERLLVERERERERRGCPCVGGRGGGVACLGFDSPKRNFLQASFLPPAAPLLYSLGYCWGALPLRAIFSSWPLRGHLPRTTRLPSNIINQDQKNNSIHSVFRSNFFRF